MLFEKKEYIFRKKDKETWLQIKKALKAEGIKGLSFGHFDGDTLPTCGCGAKLDPRNYGEKGFADHDVYYVKATAAAKDAALDCIKRHGLVAVVDMDAAMDAAKRYEQMGAFR